MKTIVTLLMLIGFINIAISQEDSTKTESKNDTTRIVLGKKGIKIIDSENRTDIKVRDKDNDKADKDKNKKEEGMAFEKIHKKNRERFLRQLFNFSM